MQHSTQDDAHKVRILINVEPFEKRVVRLEGSRVEEVEVDRGGRLVGNIYKGVIERLAPGIDSVFVNIGEEQNAFLYADDIVLGAIGVPSAITPFKSIITALEVGGHLMVQVVRPAWGRKGARLTTRISLRGRFVDLITQGADHVSISHLITDRAERERLQRLTERLRPFDYGLYVRPEAQGHSEDEFMADIDALTDLWHQLVHAYQTSEAPALLYRDPGLLERALLSMTVPEVDEIIIDAREEHEFLLKLARRIRPDLVQRIKLHDASIPLFHAYGVEEQLATALSPVVELPSGGYIVIETTEALTSIDVNSGRVLSGDSAEVLLRINLEAADEIARQLRLRDIGGLIVIDFLDMMRSRDWIKLMDHLERALSRDYARTKIVTVSPIGVVELTRQRHGYSLAQTMLMQCPCCSGTGRVKSPITVALEIRRCLFTESELHPSNIEAVICAHPEALAYFASVGEDELQRLEMRLGRQIWLFTNNSHHVEEFSIAFGAKALSEQLEAQPQEGTQVAIQVPKDVHPSDEPLFAVVKNRLVRLPPMQSPLPPQLSLRIMRIHRWYTEATWMPSIDEEVSEQLRKPAQAVEPDS